MNRQIIAAAISLPVAAGVSPAQTDWGNALSFDGVNDAAIVANAPLMPTGNAPYTAEMWVLVRSYRSYAGGYNGFVWSVGDEGHGRLTTIVVLNHNIGLTHWNPDWDTGVPLPLCTWTHIATTWDGAVQRLFVNGSEVWSAGAAPFDLRAGSVTFGKHDNYDDYYLDGLIDEVRIWDVARSPAEIAGAWDRTVDPGSPNLVAYWNFDEPSGDQFLDLAGGQDGLLHGAARVESPVPCVADYNHDCAVNTLDVLAFLNGWVAQDPHADINGDGTINTLDVLAFLNAWAAGC
jgi:hypothetical protein